jgi:hypothetical protein
MLAVFSGKMPDWMVQMQRPRWVLGGAALLFAAADRARHRMQAPRRPR